MTIIELVLTNYRNHKKLKIAFSEKTNAIVGENGVGKTNVLEAIHFLSTCKPARGRYHRDIINIGQDYCTLGAKVLSEQGEQVLDISVSKNPTLENSSIKKVKINKSPKSILRLLGTFTSVLFSPQDIDGMLGAPANRRDFVDSVLCQIDKLYKESLARYQKTLRQRNKVLEQIRENKTALDLLEFWDVQLVREAKVLQQKRELLLAFIQNSMAETLGNIEGSAVNTQVKYLKNELTQERLAEWQHREISAKTTLIGPHRDDFELRIDNMNIAHFGSRGRQRGAVLALKLAELDFIRNKTGESPVLLLDDIFSEFDEKHKKTILSVVHNQQTIITDTQIPVFFVPENVISLPTT